MITVSVRCDVPSCTARHESRSLHLDRQAVRVGETVGGAVIAGWWVDQYGRAWCPAHRTNQGAAS